VDLWRLTDDELRGLVRRGPMTRAKLAGLRRNLAVAIGNSRDPEVLAALDEPAGERPSLSDPLVKEHVAWAREQIDL
jgi:epoxyqueuosine reductase